MTTVYHIRFLNILDVFGKDKDELRLKRELMQLELDINRAIKRNTEDDYSTEQLEMIYEKVDSVLDDIAYANT